MIEDDLSASPIRLRHEIRRLRGLLPENLRGEGFDGEMRDLAIGVMSGRLCPLRGGAGCACPGTCHQHAEEIMQDLEANNFVVRRAVHPAIASAPSIGQASDTRVIVGLQPYPPKTR